MSHATTRYQRVNEALIDQLQGTHKAGGNLDEVAEWLSLKQKRIILAETLDADRVMVMPTRAVLDGEAELGPMTDFKRAIVAELLMTTTQHRREDYDARARSLLEAAARSPTASPTLEYEPLYRDLAEVDLLAGDRTALTWLKRAPAHNLRYFDGDDVFYQLVDLASGYLQLGDLDQGLSILARLIRHDPGSVLIYRFMATGFPTLGLTELGVRGAERGLDVLSEVENLDPEEEEELRDEFMMARVNLWASQKEGREEEVSPEVLADLHDAMTLDPEAGAAASPEELCRETIPDWEEVPVKDPLRFEDLPAPVRARVKET